MKCIWNGYEYEAQDGTWASPLAEFMAVIDADDEPRVSALVQAQGYEVAEVVFADDRSEGYPTLAIILPSSSDRAAMQREFNELADSVRRQLAS